MASPVGATDVAFERMTGTETLGRPFEFDVDMVSAKGDIAIGDALGKPLTVAFSMGPTAPGTSMGSSSGSP